MSVTLKRMGEILSAFNNKDLEAIVEGFDEDGEFFWRRVRIPTASASRVTRPFARYSPDALLLYRISSGWMPTAGSVVSGP